MNKKISLLLSITFVLCAASCSSQSIKRKPSSTDTLDAFLGERLEPGEDQLIAGVEKNIQDMLVRDNPSPSKTQPMPRDAHAKGHGCVKAFFKVDNHLLPDAQKVGIFKEDGHEF